MKSNKLLPNYNTINKYQNSLSGYNIIETFNDKNASTIYNCSFSDNNTTNNSYSSNKPIINYIVTSNDDISKNYLLKQIYIGNNTNKPEYNQYIYEIEKLRNICHKHIIKIYHHFYEKEALYILYEYCEGGTLQSLFDSRKKENSPFSEAEIFEFTVQILSALAYIHSRDIIHRDISLSNIGITKGNLKIMNWKSCISYSNNLSYNNNEISNNININKSNKFLETPSNRFGTHMYQSPEVLMYKSYNDKVDCWALGICLITLCKMSYPFYSNNIIDLKTEILNSVSDNYLDSSQNYMESPISNINNIGDYNINNIYYTSKKLNLKHNDNIKNENLIKIINSLITKAVDERISSKDALYTIEKEIKNSNIKINYSSSFKKISNTSLYSIKSNNNVSNNNKLFNNTMSNFAKNLKSSNKILINQNEANNKNKNNNSNNLNIDKLVIPSFEKIIEELNDNNNNNVLEENKQTIVNNSIENNNKYAFKRHSYNNITNLNEYLSPKDIEYYANKVKTNINNNQKTDVFDFNKSNLNDFYKNIKYNDNKDSKIVVNKSNN